MHQDARRALLRNEPLKLLVLAGQRCLGGKLPGLVASNLLALALQEGCTYVTLRALLKLGCDVNAPILLRSELGEPVSAILPLSLAVDRMDEGLIGTLLRAGADPLRADPATGAIPLIEALKSSMLPKTLTALLLESARRLHGASRLCSMLMAYRRSAWAPAAAAATAGSAARAAL